MADRIVNINCTYVCYDEDESKTQKFRLKTQLFKTLQLITTLFFLLAITATIFSFQLFRTGWYNQYLSQPVWIKILVLFSLNIFIGIITPFKIENEKKEFVSIEKATLFTLIILNIIAIGIIAIFWKGV